MNIIETLKHYAGNWSVSDQRKLNTEELAMIASCKVVPSNYGESLCLFLVNGQQSFIPLSSTATAKAGDIVDKNNITVITLSKEGESDILRAEC